MSIKSITRRGFLRGCCILAGGLAMGVHWTGGIFVSFAVALTFLCFTPVKSERKEPRAHPDPRHQPLLLGFREGW